MAEVRAFAHIDRQVCFIGTFHTRGETLYDMLQAAWQKWETDYELDVPRSSMVGDDIELVVGLQRFKCTIERSGFSFDGSLDTWLAVTS